MKTKEYWITWIKAALVRAVKTAAQTMSGLLIVGAAMSDLDWVQIISVSAVAFIASIVTSLAGLPEIELEDSSDESAGD